MQNRSEVIVSARVIKNYLTMGSPIGETLRDLAEIQPKYRRQWTVIASKCESGARLADQLREQDLWPESMIAAVGAGEESSAIEMVLDRVVNFNIELQKINAMIRGKLIGPSVFVVAGILIFVGFMTFVLPGISKPLKKARDRQGLIAVSDWFVNMYTNHLLTVILVSVGTLVGLVLFLKQKPVQAAMFRFLDTIPVLGSGLKEIYLGFWLEFMAILDAAGDIPYETMVRISSSIVPMHYRQGMLLILRDSAGGAGIANAVDERKWPKGDIRHGWPKMFKGVLRQSASLSIKDAFTQAARPMIEEGSVKIQQVLGLFNLVAMAIAGGGILTPLGGMMMVQLEVVNKMR